MATHTTIRITTDQAAALRRFALDLSASAGRRLSLGAALAAAVAVAAADLPAAVAAVPTGDE